MASVDASLEQGSTLADYFAVFRRRRIYLFTIIPAFLLVAIFFAYTLAPQYRSTATILLEGATMPDTLVKTTVTGSTAEQIELVQRKVLAADNLESVVKEWDPYPREKMTEHEKARQMMQDTSIEQVDPLTLKVVPTSPAFSLHYQNPSAAKAAEGAKRLADLFLTYNRRTRTEAASDASRFLNEQADKLNEEAKQLDQQLAQLRVKYGDGDEGAQQRNQSGLERAERDLDTVQGELVVAEEKASLLNLQLGQTSPNLVTAGGDLTDLPTLRAQLAEATQRYTPDHPDVKRLQRAIAALAAQNAAGNGARVKVPDNPEYMRIESQLQSANKELAGLQGRANRIRAQMGQYQSLLHLSPEAQQAFAQIDRRRAAIQQQYHDIQEKLQSAKVAQSFETEQRGERFTLIGAPYAAIAPYSPNRLGLMLVGLVLGTAVAIGVIAAVEAMDSSVRGTRDVPDLLDVPLLGTVPIILTPADRRRRTLKFGILGSVYAAAAVIVALRVFTS